jgi:catechol-2,3-dioxygenase
MGIVRVADITLMSKDAQKRAKFYDSIGLLKTLDQGGLKCFPLGDKELAVHEEMAGDPRRVIISLLVDDLESLIKQLKEKGVKFDGPAGSHMGTMAVSVSDPEGFGLELHQLDRMHPQQARFLESG